MRNWGWAVGVVVPARNEELNITACIDAILASLDACGSVASCWIVVVADGCQDQTVQRARARLGERGEVVVVDVSSPGTARRLGVDRVLQQFMSLDFSNLWIANTDADSTPHPDWIAQQLELASAGCCGVAGIVHVPSIDAAGSDVIDYWRAQYSNSPAVPVADGLDVGGIWAGRAADGFDGVAGVRALELAHHHVHGANLGIRADAYLNAGGWSDLALAEDHCLWGRVRANGWRVAASIACVVTTSGRLNGRATGGFADTLRKMALSCA